MHARYYSPGLGRFLSVDPGGVDLKRPQMWNRYGYVTNNPVNKADPDGKDEYVFTWKATKNSPGHSAIAVQNRDANGRPLGTVTVRDLWPGGDLGKFTQSVPGNYRTEILPENGIGAYNNKMGRPADGIIRIRGDAKQDATVTEALVRNSKEKPNYNVSQVCSTYNAAGTAAIGLPNTQTGTVTIWGGGVFNAILFQQRGFVTPMALYNSLASSRDSRVQVLRAPDDTSPNIDIRH